MHRYITLGLTLGTLFFTACKKENMDTATASTQEESYDTGEVSVYVEESVVPIFEDINMVFKSRYPKATINIIPASENKILKLVFEDSTRLAFLPRKFDKEEAAYFQGKVVPKQTAIAKDAIIFIVNKASNDSLIKYEDIVALLKNPDTKSDKVIVFDNINSSLVNQFKKEAGITQPGKNVYFLPTTARVVDYISKSKNAIGIVGLNWLLQPDDSLAQKKDKIKSLAVFNAKDNNYYKASQTTIADGTYPVTREIYMLDLQGKNGLGKGFASFAASDIGQRVVLKSGLLPVNIPPREIIINSDKSSTK